MRERWDSVESSSRNQLCYVIVSAAWSGGTLQPRNRKVDEFIIERIGVYKMTEERGPCF